MEQKIDEFSMKAAMDFAKSDAGKAIFATLNSNHKGELEKIRQLFSSGDMNGAKAAITALLSSSEDLRSRLPKDGV